jgi:hypothetical protein
MASSVTRVARKAIKPETTQQLFVSSGGRCQFKGCNDHLLSHHVTSASGNYAEQAHIVAYSPKGPRGDDSFDRANINDIRNLMLLCQRCHKLIDDHPDDYPVALLEEYKQEHEKRIFDVTGVAPEVQTRVITLAARIRNQVSKVPLDSVVGALGGVHFNPREVWAMDLSDHDVTFLPYWPVAQYRITKEVSHFTDRATAQTAALPISVFGIARIPLLIHLGSILSNKVPVKVYNRQLLDNDWSWKDAEPVSFTANWLRKIEGADVVILVSLSGTVLLDKLPTELQNGTSVVEITANGVPPSRTCLEAQASMKDFQRCYLAALQEARALQPKHLHIVPAVPTAAAIHLGHNLLLDADPPALIYDLIGQAYEYTLTVNTHD